MSFPIAAYSLQSDPINRISYRSTRNSKNGEIIPNFPVQFAQRIIAPALPIRTTNSWVSNSLEQPRTVSSSLEQSRTASSSLEQPRAASNSLEQPRTVSNSLEQSRTVSNSLEQPRTVSNSLEQPRAAADRLILVLFYFLINCLQCQAPSFNGHEYVIDGTTCCIDSVDIGEYS